MAVSKINPAHPIGFASSCSQTEFRVPEKEENKLPITLPIGKSNMLIENDAPESPAKTNENENRSKIGSAESKEDAGKLFNPLSVGRQIECPIDNSLRVYILVVFRDKYVIGTSKYKEEL